MPLNTHSERLWQNCDVLLYLCRFMNGKELALFATSCRLIHQTIVDRPAYWEHQFKRKFCLGDRREQEWLTWHNWCIDTTTKSKELMANINETKQEHLLYSTSKTIDNIDNEYTLSASYSKYISDFSATQWFYAYQRRRQTNHNFMAGQLKKQTCKVPLKQSTEPELLDVNPWYSLVLDREGNRFWSIQHNIFSNKNEHSNNELTCKELPTSLSSFLFDSKYTVILHSYGLRRFVVATVDIKICNELNSITPGDPIVNANELKAQYIEEAEHKATDNLGRHFNATSTITSSNEREYSWRKAILVWPNAGNSLPNIIYLGCIHEYGKSEEFYCFSDIHNEWMLLHTKYPQYPYQRFDLFDLDGNRWIKGLQLDDYSTSACIQFASRDQCQFLTCTLIHDTGEFNLASTFMASKDPQTVDDDYQSLYIQWEIFDARKSQSKSNRIISNQITIPYWPDATITVETYTERMCLITVDHSSNSESNIKDKIFSNLLLFFVIGKDASNASSRSLFDARDYGQLLPIDSFEQGRVLWSRPIRESTITNLYSKKLIVLQSNETIDVLDARAGNLLRSIVCVNNIKITPFLGSLCELFIWNLNESWFIDMQTGRIYKPPACFNNWPAKINAKDKLLDLIEVPQLPDPREDSMPEHYKHKLSTGIIGKIDDNNHYEAYMI
ncbi:hypothetical protein BDF19DRAFT_466983 [Syncephalis fuscata]|nr:hypothetical protein BDF19DRAFT_466983 [Syncephalis fuscata]